MALLIVNSVEEMVDTSQQYVLASTGTIWQYSTKTITTDPHNVILDAVNENGQPFNDGVGWKPGYYLSSSTGKEAELNYYEVTGFIKFTRSNTFRIKNIQLASIVYDTFCFYDGDFNFVKTFTGNSSYNPTSQFLLDDGTYECNLDNLIKTNMTDDQKDQVQYLRISAGTIKSTVFATIDEPLEPTIITITDWMDTGVKYQDTSEDLVELKKEVVRLDDICKKLKKYMGLHS